MFSRSSRKRLSSRSVSVPHQSGADLRVPLGRRERPCPVSLCPAAAHLWPQVSRPRRRVGARPELTRGLQGAEGVKSGSPVWERERPGTVALNNTIWGRHGKLPPSPLPLRQLRIPPLKPHRPASFNSSHRLNCVAVFWGVLCCPLLGSTSLVKGERTTVASPGLWATERSCFCFLETRDQGVSGRQSPSYGHFLVTWRLHQRQPPWVRTPFPMKETTFGVPAATCPNVLHLGEEHWSQIRPGAVGRVGSPAWDTSGALEGVTVVETCCVVFLF